MKANRSFRCEDNGVSNVMGGILFFSLVFMFLVVIRVDFVPNWEEDKEAARFTALQGQLAGFKSEADRQATNQTVSEVGHALTIGDRSTSRYLVAPARSGTLSFTPNTATSTVSAPELRVFSRGGQVAGVTSETWQGVGSNVEADIQEVQHLRLRVDNPDAKGQGDNVRLTITDAAGGFAGSLEVYIAKSSPEVLLGVRVRASDNAIVNEEVTAYHQSTSVTSFWVDALRDDLGFDDVLRGAEGPFKLTLTKVNLDAHYTITYQKSAGGGSVFVGGSGTVIPSFARTIASGRMDVEATVREFPEYHYHYENGAVILHQDDGAILRVEPGFTVQVLGATTAIKMTVPGLTGAADSVSLPGTATVYLDGQGAAQITGSAPAWTYTVTTAHPDAWKMFFQDAGRRSGLDVGAGEYMVSSTPSSATITIYGKLADPLSTSHDLSIDLTSSNVAVRIET